MHLILLRAAALLVGALVLSRVARFLVRRFERRLLAKDEEEPGLDSVKRARTLGSVIYTIARIVIWTVALVAAASSFAQDIKALVATVGVAGFALAVGAKDVGSDVVSGFYILLERQYDVGDIVSVAGVSGVVENITLRTTILRDLDGQRHVVPNGEVRVTSNYTKGFSRYLFDLPVGYDYDIDEAIELATQSADAMRQDDRYGRFILGPMVVLGVDEYADSWVNVRVYVETTPGQQWAIGRALRRRIKLDWEAAGIHMPYPHQVFVAQSAGPDRLLDGGSHEDRPSGTRGTDDRRTGSNGVSEHRTEGNGSAEHRREPAYGNAGKG